MSEFKDPLRAGANYAVDDDDDNLSLASQDLESAAKKTQSIGNAAKKAATDVQDFAAKQRQKMFSLDEFNSQNRQVLIKAVAGEFLVTMIFIFVVCAVGINTVRSGHADSEALVVGALATGFCAVALIYSFADVSGANFNPAVTFACIVTGKTSVAKGLSYMAAQLSGSMIAMLLLTIVFPPAQNADGTWTSVVSSLVVSPGADANLARAMVMEIILSFILVYVIFATAFDTVGDHTDVKLLDDNGQPVAGTKHKAKLTIYTTSGSSKAGFAPLSIGLTLGFLCFLGGSVSGGAFNPARATSAALCSGNLSYLWLYWISDFTGASMAGLVQQRFFTSHPQPKQ